MMLFDTTVILHFFRFHVKAVKFGILGLLFVYQLLELFCAKEALDFLLVAFLFFFFPFYAGGFKNPRIISRVMALHATLMKLEGIIFLLWVRHDKLGLNLAPILIVRTIFCLIGDYTLLVQVLIE